MITYNNRFRGMFEYDKFVLNILSFHNVINEIEAMEIHNTDQDINSFKEIKKIVDRAYSTFTANNGLSDKIFIEIIKKGGIK